ncbi:U3 small nucleolar RNA-associated protein 4 homolog [Uloborus diversus]|uniref:U3 small nucleolar RNA-associated protein 4 homolog n=1 Tax=Uloborus diversus TaxID=327109 RepID=UPI0024092058|nr:U3 small nucleolar RNA-associated protein 4 homolog [Uloborus diversus]
MSSARKLNCRVHVINFFEPKPQAIRYLAYDSFSSRLAVSRADSSIEIWDTSKIPFLELTIPGSSDTSENVSALAWSHGRLFSAGISGYIAEHDFTTHLPKYEVLVTSGCPIRCMSFNDLRTCLAIGNDDGHVVLHDLSPNYLDFQKKLDKQEGGIICLDWHKDGNIIVTGSMDVIRVWNVETGHVVNRIILSRASKNTPTIVWCIAVTSDFTIISGDSCGKTSFWDGNSCTLLSSFNVHSGDVLTFCLNKEEDTLYCSGVDSTIVKYMKCETLGKWMKSIQIYVHTHDVQALQLVGDYLVSGGDDCSLVFSKYPPKTTIKYFPFSQKSFCEVAAKAQCALLKYANYLEVWRIGSSTSPMGSSTTPINLLQIRTKDSEAVVSCSLSSDCKWLAYSSQYKLRLFNLHLEEDPLALKILSKVSLPSNISNTASIILFSLAPTKMIFYCKGKTYILKCDTEAAKLIATLHEDPDCEEEVHLMDLSGNNAYLACGSHNGKVVIFSLETNKVICRLPVYKHQPTALKFDSRSENLIVVYSDRKVIEYSIARNAYTSWCKQQMLVDFQSISLHPVTSIACCSDKLILSDENSLYLFDKANQLQPLKKRLKKSEVEEIGFNENTFKKVTKYEHISCIHSYNNDVVLVQIPTAILELLPPPIWKKKYGT